jgi:hypothetical protein
MHIDPLASYIRMPLGFVPQADAISWILGLHDTSDHAPTSWSLSDWAWAGSVKPIATMMPRPNCFMIFLHTGAIARCGAARGNQHVFRLSPAVGTSGRRSIHGLSATSDGGSLTKNTTGSKTRLSAIWLRKGKKCYNDDNCW